MALTLAKSDAITAFSSILANDGGTFDIAFGVEYYDTEYRPADFVSGFMVSDSGAEVVYSLDTFDAVCLLDYANDHSDALHYGFLGAWIHEGFVYLDVSRHYATEYDARIAGANNRQLAVWDIANGEEITL